MTAPRSGFDLALWRRLLSYARPYRRTVAALAAAAVATAAVDTSFPLVTRRLIDDVVARGTAAPIGRYALAYLGLTALLATFVGTFVRLGGRIRTHVAHDIRRAGFENLQQLSFSFYDRRPVGWLVARMTSDCDRLSMIMAWGVLDFCWGSMLMTGIAIVMVALDWRLALLVLAVVPALALVSARFQKRILGSSRAVRRTNSRITAAFGEAIAGVRTSKAFGREARELAEFRGVTGEMWTVSMRNALLSALYLPIVLTLASVATGLALAFGGLEVTVGRISLGTLVAFMTYTRHFFDPIQEMAFWFAEMQMAQASAERILGLVDEVPRVRDSGAVRDRIERTRAAGPRPPGVAEDGGPDRIGRIEFRDVAFAYDEGPRILDGFDLVVEPGETIALVGPTGGGKSTIVSLLCRFYEPTAGEILLDGVDYRGRSLHWLQSKLGIVLQTPHLFRGSVAENIRYGRLDATDPEVEEAARLAGAHDFVLALEHGYATEVGEQGNRLSTGQKQLVSFARAILADPALLVLDEATSSIDTETERRIREGMGRLLHGRTSLVIAHRLSTVRDADRILFVDGGRIVEEGRHAELMARRGRYFELTTRQSLRESVREGAWGDASPRPDPA